MSTVLAAEFQSCSMNSGLEEMPSDRGPLQSGCNNNNNNKKNNKKDKMILQKQ